MLQADLCRDIRCFFNTGTLPNGANSAFFHSSRKLKTRCLFSSLDRSRWSVSFYKIVAKILTNRLLVVINKIVSPGRSAFISGRQILDGPIMLSEIMSWFKKTKRKMLLFKVNFEKEYDSVDYWLSQYGSNLGVEDYEVDSFANAVGCRTRSFPTTYLGVPIGANMNLLKKWESLINKYKARLSSWKASLISSGGRLTLIKSVMGSLGIYFMSLFKCPETILKQLEAIRARFFWGGNASNKEMAWVKWKSILASFEKGGLNVGSLKAFTITLLQK
ncbi:uncharacterized protein [Rutidosis leptorrhynchoides]|uniref:uncharacterized protein n=1 Tax=Rutidosis leptorrhynchoides TaxID=125765 RepID=UPI003A9A5CCC